MQEAKGKREGRKRALAVVDGEKERMKSKGKGKRVSTIHVDLREMLERKRLVRKEERESGIYI